MEEVEVIRAVRGWLERQQFRAKEEFFVDEAGTPIRPDLFAVRDQDPIERLAVECKGTRGDVARGLHQARACARLADRSLLAIPSTWQPTTEGARKGDAWAELRRNARDAGVDVLTVDPDGTVHVA